MSFSEEEVEHIVDLVSGMNSLLPLDHNLPSYVRIGDIPVTRSSTGQLLGHVILDRNAWVFRFRTNKIEREKL